MTWFVKLQLAEYQQLFNESFEVSKCFITMFSRVVLPGILLIEALSNVTLAII